MNLTGLAPYQKTPNMRHTASERRYYQWISMNCTCCLTGRPEFEIAHTGGLAEGKGMSRKAALQTCLPLIRQLHVAEERGRGAFWNNAGLPDYLTFATQLYNCFERDGSPSALLAEMQARADRAFLIEILKGE